MSGVVDGDTPWIVRAGRRVEVRLVGIDTPETVAPNKPVQCFGKEASTRTKSLLVGAQLFVRADPTRDRVDKYGRELDYLWLADGRFFKLVMIQEGFAFEYTHDLPYHFQAQFRAAQRRRSNVVWASGPERRPPGTWANPTSPLSAKLT